jgi:hypothetical protein
MIRMVMLAGPDDKAIRSLEMGPLESETILENPNKDPL